MIPACSRRRFFYEMSLRWRVRTCRAACISLLPPRGLSTGSCGSPACRNPPTTVSVHTVRRCCLLRPLIILRLLSEERTRTKADIGVSSVAEHGILCSFDYLLLKSFCPDKTTLRTTLQVSADNRPFHCFRQVLIMGLDNPVCAHNYSSGFLYLKYFHVFLILPEYTVQF